MPAAVNLCVGGRCPGLLPLPLKVQVDKEELDTRIDQTRTLPDRLSDRHRKNVHFLVDERKITRQMRCTLLSSSFICFSSCFFNREKLKDFFCFFFHRTKPLLGRIDCFSDNPGLFTKDRLSLFHKQLSFDLLARSGKKRKFIYLCIC